MSEPTWTFHENGAAMAEGVATRVESVAQEAIAARGRALLALPGGQSPIRIFEQLGARPIDWTRVVIVPTDDRVVAAGHPLSNSGLLTRFFRERGACLVPLVTQVDGDYRAAGERADEALRALPWPPDLVWLGVGIDGHTASIFPGPDLLTALDTNSARRALGVLPDPLPPEAPVPRVTLTRSAIQSGRHVLLALSGDEKRAVVERALGGRDVSSSPIAQVLLQAPMPIEVHWSPS